MGKHFVLIHGAWHGGWCWDGVISALEAAGHTAEAPDMPGHAPGDDRSTVTFGDYVDRVVDAVAVQPVPVVLVGHSSAGFLLQSAAPRLADKLERLVFLNAFILPDGMAQFDLVPPDAAQGMIAAAAASPDNCVPVIEPFVREALMAGESEEATVALLARLTPQPLALFTTKVSTVAFGAVTTPKVVVFGTNDASLPPGSFQQMAAGLGEHVTIEFDGGHEALVTQPLVVAARLIEAAG